jgi:ABC-2 type transport system ATP-binding protein
VASAVPDPSQPAQSVVSARGVVKRYGSTVALAGLDADIGPGITGLLGSNGAGKTTFISLILGLRSRDAGELTVLGHDPATAGIEVRSRMGYAPEHHDLPAELAATDLVRHLSEMHLLAQRAAVQRANDALWLVGLGEERFRPVGTMSTGQRQRVKLASAIAHDPEVVLLDEPFNGMDPRQRLHLMDLLHSAAGSGRTILFSSHILEEVERLSGTIQVMVSGRLAASGDFRAIRRLMTSRPLVFLVRTSDDRLLATALMGRPSVTGVELTPRGVQVRTSDYGTFTRELAGLSRDAGIRLREVLPADESLESVFAYLVAS